MREQVTSKWPWFTKPKQRIKLWEQILNYIYVYILCVCVCLYINIYVNIIFISMDTLCIARFVIYVFVPVASAEGG